MKEKKKIMCIAHISILMEKCEQSIKESKIVRYHGLTWRRPENRIQVFCVNIIYLFIVNQVYCYGFAGLALWSSKAAPLLGNEEKIKIIQIFNLLYLFIIIIIILSVTNDGCTVVNKYKRLYFVILQFIDMWWDLDSVSFESANFVHWFMCRFRQSMRKKKITWLLLLLLKKDADVSTK
jgi:hypothetical protein